MNKIIQFISYITITVSFLLISLAIFWLIYPYNPITFNGQQKIVTKEVKRGEHIVYTIDYCKKVNVIPIVTKTFVDGIIYAVPEVVAVDREVGCGVQPVQMYVPKALPTGEYYLKLIYRYQVNPLRNITVITTTEKFTIK